MALYLQSNKISDINPLISSPFKNLLRLNLSSNGIKEGLSSDLVLPKLIKLDLSSNNIEDISLILGKMKIIGLKYLSLGSNKISDISEIVNYEIKELINLDLYDNKILDVNCLMKAKFINLKIMNFEKNEIKDLNPFSNLPMKNLKILKFDREKKEEKAWEDDEDIGIGDLF